jgi:hypothetical protein
MTSTSTAYSLELSEPGCLGAAGPQRRFGQMQRDRVLDARTAS